MNVWLDLIATDSSAATSEFELNGLGKIGGSGSDVFANLPVGKNRIVQLDLMDFFSEFELTNYFIDRGGIFDASFHGNAIVYGATMNLKAVPEPTSLLLLTAGLLGLIAQGRKIRFEGGQKAARQPLVEALSVTYTCSG